MPSKFYQKNAFSLHEIIIAVALVGILIGIAVPAVGLAREKARDTETAAALRILNTIASQTKDAGITNAGNTGSDKSAALAYYNARGWIKTQKPLDISKLTYTNGVWGRE